MRPRRHVDAPALAPMMGDGDAVEDAYAVLGVDRAASDAEVRRAYQRLALTHHPDRAPAGDAGGAGADDHADASAGGGVDSFVRVQRAYETLREPASRAHHDATLADDATAATQTRSIVSDVDFDELEPGITEAGNGVYWYDCRCGDVYEICAAELRRGSIDVWQCRSCSLAIRPVGTPEQQQQQQQQDREPRAGAESSSSLGVHAEGANLAPNAEPTAREPMGDIAATSALAPTSAAVPRVTSLPSQAHILSVLRDAGVPAVAATAISAAADDDAVIDKLRRLVASLEPRSRREALLVRPDSAAPPTPDAAGGDDGDDGDGDFDDSGDDDGDGDGCVRLADTDWITRALRLVRRTATRAEHNNNAEHNSSVCVSHDPSNGRVGLLLKRCEFALIDWLISSVY